MAKMRTAAAQALHRAAVDRAAAQLPPDISAPDAYRLGVKRGNKQGYQSGFRLAQKFERLARQNQKGKAS